jgi:hypothetical protein
LGQQIKQGRKKQRGKAQGMNDGAKMDTTIVLNDFLGLLVMDK